MKMNKPTLFTLIFVYLLLVVIHGQGVALAGRISLPSQELSPGGEAIHYSGYLTDDAGKPVPDGLYDFEYAIYGAEDGGLQLWSGTALDVLVEGGSFAIPMGSKEENLALSPDGSELWLAVSVRGPGEAEFTSLTPRQPLSDTLPASPTAGPACPHNHMGELWSGSGSGLSTYVNSSGIGLYGRSTGNIGVLGVNHTGTFFLPSGNHGVYGFSSAGSGVYGVSSYTHGIYGATDADWSYNSGVYGYATKDHANGVTGWNTGAGTGVYGYSASGYAGFFSGQAYVSGMLWKAGGGFKIDHPLDPADQYLNHSFVESPDMMNIYNGTILLDAKGEAWVALPDWFEALNQNFHYQLTPIGAPGPNLYIAQEIQDNHFQIAGGAPGTQVSWQVTGIRNDPWAEAHRIPVEQAKPLEEQGTYLHPVEQGLPETLGLDYGQDQVRP
jgi:hypothetical protein